MQVYYAVVLLLLLTVGCTRAASTPPASAPQIAVTQADERQLPAERAAPATPPAETAATPAPIARPAAPAPGVKVPAPEPAAKLLADPTMFATLQSRMRESP